MDEQNGSISQVSIEEQNNDLQSQQNMQDTYNCLIQLQKDLEFVQLLANPVYVIQLHIRGYLYDERFQLYVQKLKYLDKPQYIALIKYPQGLLNLDRIRSKGFAQYLKKPENVNKFKKLCLDRNQLISKSAH